MVGDKLGISITMCSGRLKAREGTLPMTERASLRPAEVSIAKRGCGASTGVGGTARKEARMRGADRWMLT